jgi:hypothetical protein
VKIIGAQEVQRRSRHQIFLATFWRLFPEFPQLIAHFQPTRRRNLGLAETALTGPLHNTQYASTKQRPFPHRRFCCPLGSTSTTAASDAHPASHSLPEVIGYRAPRSGNNTAPQVTGPGRASPVPAATVCTFRAPYAGESFGACTSRSSAPSMAFTVISAARHSLHPTHTGRDL